MNKKHGLVATAWMLGGGLLLNASLVEAQVATPADEYFAPQRSAPFSTKKAPGLLPQVIRNADASNSPIARPISPSDLSAGRKINGTSVAPKRPAKRVTIALRITKTRGRSNRRIRVTRLRRRFKNSWKRCTAKTADRYRR